MCVCGNPDFTVVRAPSWAKWCCCCSIKLFLGFFLAVTWGWSWSLTIDVLHLATDFSDTPKDGESSRRALGKTPGPGVTVDVLLERHAQVQRPQPCPGTTSGFGVGRTGHRAGRLLTHYQERDHLGTKAYHHRNGRYQLPFRYAEEGDLIQVSDVLWDLLRKGAVHAKSVCPILICSGWHLGQCCIMQVLVALAHLSIPALKNHLVGSDKRWRS